MPPIMIRPGTTYNVAMRGIPHGILVIVLVFTPSVLAQSQNGEVTQVPPIAPAAVNRAFQEQEIYSTPPTLPLIPNSPQAHHGNVWLRTTEDGLHIWGKADSGDQEIRWAQQKSEILASDHVEVWLAAATEVAMPPIGWGNQFGMDYLKSRDDCADATDSHTGDKVSGRRNCERWYEEQREYTPQVRRLFVRQWLITGNGPTRCFEEFASSAYDSLTASLFPEDVPKLLKPESADPLKVEIAIDFTPENRKTAAGREYQYNRPTGYHFHVFIPYTAFPPAQQLKLSDLYVMVDVFGSAAEGQKQGAYSTTAPKRQWGTPETFNHIRLDEPRTFAVTPCGYELEQKDLYNEPYSAWFFPSLSKNNDLHSTFALINPEEGYLYDPGGMSPSIWPGEYFWKPLKGGATVCGPSLAWRKDGSIRRTEFNVDEQHFATKTLADGWTLLRSGPSTSPLSAFGSGACGSCPVLDFAIYAISPRGEITKALDLNEQLTGPPNAPSGADMTIAEDWSHIILYLAGEEEFGESGWKSVTYCLNSHAYKQCGEAKNVQAPNPPHYKDLRPME